MNVKLTKKLFEKYPKIFAGKDKSIRESLIPFGIETGDGWYWLVDSLCQAIQNHCEGFAFDKGKPVEQYQVEAVQVKEKFGGLRFYVNGADDKVYGMINLAEQMSYKICERCGSTDGVTQTKGWIYTLCKNCLKIHI